MAWRTVLSFGFVGFGTLFLDTETRHYTGLHRRHGSIFGFLAQCWRAFGKTLKIPEDSKSFYHKSHTASAHSEWAPFKKNGLRLCHSQMASPALQPTALMSLGGDLARGGCCSISIDDVSVWCMMIMMVFLCFSADLDWIDMDWWIDILKIS